MKNTKWIIGIIAVVVIVGAAIWYFNTNTSSSIPVLSENTTATTTLVVPGQTYTLAEIALHNSASNCWTAVNGVVYDITKFIPSHPGGTAIIPACGKDGSALFNGERQHGRVNAQATLDTYKIGTLSTE